MQTEREDEKRRLKGAVVETRTIMCYVKQKRAKAPLLLTRRVLEVARSPSFRASAALSPRQLWTQKTLRPLTGWVGRKFAPSKALIFATSSGATKTGFRSSTHCTPSVHGGVVKEPVYAK